MSTAAPTGRVLVLQHLACEHPGSLRGLLRHAGMTMHTVELDDGEEIPDLKDFDLMVVMGGPMDVWEEDLHPWLVVEKQAIHTWVETLGRPYLGVCLGLQLLADALGGEVGLMDSPEIGVRQLQLTEAAAIDPVFGVLPPVVSGLQWHGAQVRRIPEGATILASNEACRVQAMRAGASAWGVQFHMEVLDSTVEEWAEVPEYLVALRQSGGMDAAMLEAQVAARLEAMEASTAALAQRLVAVVHQSMDQRAHAGSAQP